MLDRDQLETFAVVIEQQSFEKAATALSITRGAVSQRIKALEESLSTVLVLRDRPVSPTPAGEVLLRHVKALRVMEGAALQALAPQPKLHAPIPLSIAVNADSLATWFPEVLKELLLSQLVALEVVADDQDHTSQLLSRGEVIGCISTSAKAADGFAAECLGAMEYRCYATPQFAASAFPDGLTVPSVLTAPAVLFNRKDSLHDEFLKSRFGFSIDRYSKHFLPSPVALLEGVAMGAGYGLIPSTQAQALLDSGRLLDLCPNHSVMVDLYWHHWELEPPLAHDVTALIVKVAHRWFEHDPWLRYASSNAEPIRSSDLACSSNQEIDFTNAAAQHGFTPTLIAPAPSPVGLSRVGVLCLGSVDPSHLDGESYPKVRVLARALAMELHHWIARSMREELLQGGHLTEADLSLLRHEAAGHSSKVIGAAMNLEAKTIDCRFQRLNAKLGAPDRRSAVRIARLYGLL